MRSQRKWVFCLILVLAGLLLAATVLAQDEGGEVEVFFKRTTFIPFGEVIINGGTARPEGSFLMNRNKAKFDLLIRVRDNFLPEMTKSVDNL
ncbi:MAG: hypothetical protein JXR96_31155 [Deltaproteobacteria bacterium]|nr:hypothetical protein [Deltaproteobacteria bacterium]